MKHIILIKGTMESPKCKCQIRSVLISGTDSSIKEDRLRRFFQARRGGPIDTIDFKPGANSAVVTFSSIATAKKVVEKGDFDLDGTALKAGFAAADTNEHNLTCPLHQHKHESDMKGASDRCVIITGITKDITNNRLELFFKNKRRGGGPIEEVHFQNTADSALVTFTNTETANAVHKQRTFDLDGVTLTAYLYDATSDDTHQTDESSFHNPQQKLAVIRATASHPPPVTPAPPGPPPPVTPAPPGPPPPVTPAPPGPPPPVTPAPPGPLPPVTPAPPPVTHAPPGPPPPVTPAPPGPPPPVTPAPPGPPPPVTPAPPGPPPLVTPAPPGPPPPLTPAPPGPPPPVTPAPPGPPPGPPPPVTPAPPGPPPPVTPAPPGPPPPVTPAPPGPPPPVTPAPPGPPPPLTPAPPGPPPPVTPALPGPPPGPPPPVTPAPPGPPPLVKPGAPHPPIQVKPAPPGPPLAVKPGASHPPLPVKPALHGAPPLVIPAEVTHTTNAVEDSTKSFSKKAMEDMDSDNLLSGLKSVKLRKTDKNVNLEKGVVQVDNTSKHAKESNLNVEEDTTAEDSLLKQIKTLKLRKTVPTAKPKDPMRETLNRRRKDISDTEDEETRDPMQRMSARIPHVPNSTQAQPQGDDSEWD